MSTQNLSSPFTLYYATYSMYSTFVRTTFAMRGTPCPGRPDMTMKYHLLDISPNKSEQVSEFYLCQINPKGKVPTLVNEKLLGQPMPESLDISYYLCEWYPSLLPPDHEADIREMLGELHQISLANLTYGVNPKSPGKMLQKVNEVLSKPDISIAYRELLENKKKALESLAQIFTADALAEHERRAIEYCRKVLALMQRHGSSDKVEFRYIFGPEPTVLDAHVLSFLCRLYDVDRRHLIPESLLQWVDDYRKRDLFKTVVPGGTTKPPYAE